MAVVVDWESILFYNIATSLIIKTQALTSELTYSVNKPMGNNITMWYHLNSFQLNTTAAIGNYKKLTKSVNIVSKYKYYSPYP